MQLYLLATNLFALAALLLGLVSFANGRQSWRLLPLFLLVVSPALSLIMSLTALDQGSINGSGALIIFSTLCLVWALLDFPPGWSGRWPLIAWSGAIVALLLCVLPLFPNWPVPVQLHSLIIAIFGMPLIIASAGQVRWMHVAAPLVVALANLLALLNLTALAWLVNLLAYVILISALHRESLLKYRQQYAERQQAAEVWVQETLDLNREQQRWLEISEILNTIPNLSQSMEHIVRSMAEVTHVDQSAIFILDTQMKGQARLATLYNPRQPLHLSPQAQVVFPLENCPPLQASLESQEPLLLPQQNINGLHQLYRLWREDGAGPTLIQPLIVRGRPVGALMLGNPITSRPIRQSDIRLCRHLAPQIATIVEHRRRYQELEAEAEAMAETVHKQTQEPNPHLAILETMHDGVVVSDTNGQVQLVNQAAERILGKQREMLLGKPLGTLYLEIAANKQIDDLTATFSHRSQPLPIFFEQDERAIQGWLVPWRNDQDEWLGIIAILRDVSREVKADRARNDFIAALSRELRAPLTAVKGYSDLIVHGGMSNYTPEQLQIQRIIHSSADRVAAILDHTIQISAQNRHKLLPRFEEIDIARLIDEVLRDVTALLQQRALKLTRQIPADLPLIIADPQHIHQVLDHLLVNACHFTPPGGKITLRASIESEQPAQPHLLLVVADNGVGIPRSEQKRIFGPFYQLKNQKVEAHTGLGMGLAVVKDIVELHHGRVWVESVVGEGSTFYVSLPVTQSTF